MPYPGETRFASIIGYPIAFVMSLVAIISQGLAVADRCLLGWVGDFDFSVLSGYIAPPDFMVCPRLQPSSGKRGDIVGYACASKSAIIGIMSFHFSYLVWESRLGALCVVSYDLIMDVREYEVFFKAHVRYEAQSRRLMTVNVALDAAAGISNLANADLDASVIRSPRVSASERVGNGLDRYERFPAAARPLIARILPAVGLAREEREAVEFDKNLDGLLNAAPFERLKLANRIGLAAAAYMAGSESLDDVRLLEPYAVQVEAVRISNPLLYERADWTRSVSVSKLSEEMGSRFLAVRMIDLLEERAVRETYTPMNRRWHDVEIATHSFEGVVQPNSIQVGEESLRKISATDGRTLLVPDDIMMMVALESDVVYRFEPTADNEKFLVSSLDEPSRSAEIGGPVVSPRLTGAAEERHSVVMARINASAARVEDDLQNLHENGGLER